MCTITNGTGNNISYEYDNRGNLKVDNRFKYYYDYKNRLTKVTSLDGSLISKYYYNGLGNRIEKDVGTEKILYTYSSMIKGGALSEINSDNLTVVNITYYNYEGSNKIINTIKSTDTNNTDNNQETYYYQDRLGSTKFITDDSGEVLQSFEYDDYGKIRKIETTTNSGTTILDEVNNLLTDRLYAGYVYDKEINLYFLKNRHYSAELGRFIQTDPIEEGDDVNLYAYTKNNPLNWVDPEGTKSSCRGEVIPSNSNIKNPGKQSLVIGFMGHDWGDYGEVPKDDYRETSGIGVALDGLDKDKRITTMLYHSSMCNTNKEQRPVFKYLVNNHNKFKKIILVGHSMGAETVVELASALKIASALKKEKINIDLMITVDIQGFPMFGTQTSVSDTVIKEKNYYQDNFWTSDINGEPLSLADGNKTTNLVNIKIDDSCQIISCKKGESHWTNHENIDDLLSDTIKNDILNEINN